MPTTSFDQFLQTASTFFLLIFGAIIVVGASMAVFGSGSENTAVHTNKAQSAEEPIELQEMGPGMRVPGSDGPGLRHLRSWYRARRSRKREKRQRETKTLQWVYAAAVGMMVVWVLLMVFGNRQKTKGEWKFVEKKE